MNIKAIIFDADGVVINGKMFSFYLTKDFGLSYKKDVLPFFDNEFQPCLVGKADLKKIILAYLKKWGWEKSVDEFLEYWFKSEHNIDRRIINLIYKLRKKGIKCFLATNQEKYRTEYMLKNMDFIKIFDKIFSSAYIGYKKPQRQFYQHISKYLSGLKKDEVLYCDDKKEYVRAARNFGFNALLYTTFDSMYQYIESKVMT